MYVFFKSDGHLRPKNRPCKTTGAVRKYRTAPASWIHQSAWFHTLDLERNTYEYAMRREGNGLYVFVLEGDVTVENEKLASRDGMGIWEQNDITLHTDGKASLLLIEVPMR